MEKRALPFASTDFSSSLSSSESLASARRKSPIRKLGFLISAMAAPPNLRPLFRTRWCSGLSFLLITSTRGYVGEDGGEKYNWERYAERFTKHL